MSAAVTKPMVFKLLLSVFSNLFNTKVTFSKIPIGSCLSCFKAYKFNFAKAPEVSSDDSVEFRTGNRVYRALALADGKLADTNAIVHYKKA